MKTLVWDFLKILCIRMIPLIKLQNFRKRKMDMVHHHMPNSICMCILPHACWKSPERACLKVSLELMHMGTSILLQSLNLE